MNDEYCTLLVEAYTGELLGEALFDALAAGESGERLEKLRVLQKIEQTTGSQLRSLVRAAGIEVSIEDEAAARSEGAAMGAADLGWDILVKGLHDALPSYLAAFVRLRSIADDPSDPALIALVNHEQAINAFAELELAGRADCSLAVLQWHLDAVA